MYYKITNQDCEIYKQLREIRENEIRIERENLDVVENLLGFKVGGYVGYQGQCNFSRVTLYEGFKFPDGMVPDPKLWRQMKDRPVGVYEPNRRTKGGKAIANTLNSLKRSVSPWRIWEILGIKDPIGRFTLPQMLLCGDTLVLRLDDKQEPNLPDMVEITKRECDSIMNDNPEMPYKYETND